MDAHEDHMQITCHTGAIHCHNRHAFHHLGEYHMTGHMKDHVNITKDHMTGHMTHHSLGPSYFVLGLSPPLLHMLSLIATGVLQKALEEMDREGEREGRCILATQYSTFTNAFGFDPNRDQKVALNSHYYTLQIATLENYGS
jgi:hypothetical protein